MNIFWSALEFLGYFLLYIAFMYITWKMLQTLINFFMAWADRLLEQFEKKSEQDTGHASIGDVVQQPM